MEEALVLLLELLEFGRGGGIDKGKRAVVRGAGDFSLGAFSRFRFPLGKDNPASKKKVRKMHFPGRGSRISTLGCFEIFPSRTRCPYPV